MWAVQHKQTKGNTMYFFTKSGEYGERTPETDEQYATTNSGWMAIPTWNWTDAMWDEIHSVAGNERYKLATHFSIGIHDWDGTDSNAECQTCYLSPGDVGVRLLDAYAKQSLMEEEYYNA